MLRRSLLGWLASAEETGLDEDGIVALFTSALRDFYDRRGGADRHGADRHGADRHGADRHGADRHPAPLDPNFTGAGRCMTDSEGRYWFVTLKPGAHPWQNHPNAWRAQHIHFSLFGRAFTQRLVTQMYFPGDPLFAHDPIFNSVPDPTARERMIARFELGLTVPEGALGFEWDIVLRGRSATVFETEDHQ